MGALFYGLIKHNPTTTEGSIAVKDTYRVVCEPGDNSSVAVAAVPIVLYDFHLVYPLARAKTLDVSNPGTEGWIFDLTYSYDDKPFQQGMSGGQDPGQLSPSSDANATSSAVAPASRPWVFSYGAANVNEPMLYDALGTPLENVLHEKYVPTLEIERPQRVMRLTAWMPITFDAQGKADTYQGRVNEDTWGRYAPGEAMCTSYVPTTEREQTVDIWRIEIEVTCKKQRTLTDGRKLGGWQPVWVPHRGTKAKVTLPLVGTVVLPVLDLQGRPVKDPVFLKISTGEVATDADIAADPGPDNSGAVITDLHQAYYPYTSVPFSGMLSNEDQWHGKYTP